MRPVDLTPKGERRSGAGGARSGVASYFVIGALACALIAICAVVLLGNQVEAKRAEVASLEQEAAAAEQRASELAPFVNFQQLRDARVGTIDSLARSRFDWERVIRELSKVIPKSVWLSNMTGTVAPEVQIDDGAGISLRATIPGPAIELVGCARSQPDIARLIAAINDVDGVTRVAAVNGIKPSSPKTDESQESAESSEATTTGTCARSAPAFELVAAFDGVQVPDAASGAPVAPPATTPTSTATGETPEGPGSTETTAPDAGAEPAPGTVPGG